MLFNFALSKTIPVFSTIDYSPPKKLKTAVVNRSTANVKKLQLSFSEISIENLEKLNTLCIENGVRLIVIPPPISRNSHEGYDYSIMKNQIRDNNLENVFAEYFERLSVIDNSFFLPDNLHFKKDYINALSNEFLKTFDPEKTRYRGDNEKAVPAERAACKR